MKKKNANKGSVKTFLKVLKYLKIYRLHFAVSLLLTALSVALTLYIPILVGQAIDLCIDKGRVDFDGVSAILVKIGVCILITALAQWIINVLNNKMTYGIVKNIRKEAFVRIQQFPISFIDSRHSGEIVSRVITDVDQFSDGLLMGFTQFFSGVMTIIVTLVFMVIISPPITLIVVLVTPLSLFVAAFIAKKTYSMFKLRSELQGEQTSLIDEAVGNHKLVVAFGQEDEIQEKFDDINNKLSKASLRAVFFSSITNPSTRFVNGLVYAFVAFTGALLYINGSSMITVGMLSSFLSYSTQYTKPFNEISGVVTELQNALACASRVFELIESPIQSPDSEKETIEKAHGNIEFENVSFSYTEDRPLIRNFNLKVGAGQHIAIVGPTGCGKTTLINLLMRFYDVKEGAIKLDGVDIRDIPRSQLRRSYGMVLQDTWLCAGTIRDNIAFGDPDASEDEIIAAAKAAHAHSFIRRLPKGYDTVIGEDGGTLSQGQKQLLCIARVMLCLPEMLILDEATSSIDTRTEIRIQKAFSTMMEGRTSFIVAHRLSTIKEADMILVMKDGNIIEQGDHNTLLAQKGFYSELYQSQFASTDD
ncbi:MAG: ABC transporter ATP-binding protein [Ruminococcaceae bacterium]|nr:ABC transporter ATP-binding protein [Oscillospiraceae bacterium]